jgi:hypothetical protein
VHRERRRGAKPSKETAKVLVAVAVEAFYNIGKAFIALDSIAATYRKKQIKKKTWCLIGASQWAEHGCW